MHKTLFKTAALGMCLATFGAIHTAAAQASGPQAIVEMSGHRTLMEIVATKPLAEFTTDGCSGGLSNAWRGLSDLLPALADTHGELPPWEECCVTHDRAYHNVGGATTPEQSFSARLKADEALRQCVISTAQTRMPVLVTKYDLTVEQITTAYEIIAKAMFDAVRIGGMPCNALPWRWGYGYPQCPLLPDLFSALPEAE